MKITSSAFEHNQSIPPKYTCDGDDTNPPLSISEIPEGCKSLVLIHDDPDAPGGTWVHWILWNIEPSVTEIEENSVPPGAKQGTNSWDRTGYGGPCPPSGVHRYCFKLYALDVVLDFDESTTSEDLEEALQGHTLESAELIGIYQKA